MASQYVQIPPPSSGSSGVSSLNSLTGALSLVAGSGISVSPSGTNITISNTASGVTSVTASLPLSSSGGTTPNLTIATASASVTGALTSTDWATFNGKQNSSANLAALSLYNTNGFLVQTASNTFAGRTVTGSSGRTTVTNGDGVSGNPVIDLATSGATAGTYYTPMVTVDAYGRATAISNLDLNYRMQLYEDFVNIGQNAMLTTVSGTGAALAPSSYGVDSTNKCVGVYVFQSGTASAAYALWYYRPNAFIVNSSITHNYTARLSVGALGTALDQYTIVHGYGNNTYNATNHSYGAYFSFTSDGTATNWQCNTVNGGVSTTVDSGVAVSTTAFQFFKISLTSASAIFSINNTVVATITTNLPTSQIGGSGKIIRGATSAGTNFNIYYDYVVYTATIPGGRG